MTRKINIIIWAICFLSIFLQLFSEIEFNRKSEIEDPTNCILAYIEDQYYYLDESIVPEIYADEANGRREGLSMDKMLQLRGLSISIKENQKLVFRSTSLEGKKACNLTILKEGIQITKCVEVFGKDQVLLPAVVSSCGLKNQYKISEFDGIAFYIDNETVKLERYGKTRNRITKLLKLPFLISLFFLLLIPFTRKQTKASLKQYGVIILLLLFYFIGLQKFQFFNIQQWFDWSMPAAITVLFVSLFFWRAKHKYVSEKWVLILHWIAILIPFIFFLWTIVTTPRSFNQYSPFLSLSKISYRDLYLITSLVFFMLAHLISLYQNWQWSKRKFGLGKHLGLQILLGLGHLMAVVLLLPSFPILPIILSIGLYFLLIDLFAEGRQNPVLWSILWAVFISIIIAGSVYYSDFSYTVDEVKSEISKADNLFVGNGLKNYSLDNIPSYYVERVNNYEDIGIQLFYQKGNIHFLNHLSNGQVNIVQFPLPGFIKAVTLFSCVFLIGISIYLLMILLHKRINILPRYFYPGDIYLSSFSRRIQFSYLILTVISFIGIASITILLLNNYFKNSERQNLKSNLNLIRSHLDYLAKDDEVSIRSTEAGLMKIMHHHNYELNIYDEGGNDVIDSNAHLSSSVINYLDQHSDGSLSESSPENGFSTYLNIKHPVYRYAYVRGIDQKNDHAFSVYDFVAGILNVYVFLFIIAITFGLFVSKSIVDPLARLTKQMKQLKLGKANQQIMWTGEGEVGELIDNYNAMVVKLEESVSLIAHTERDMAWREMARQVAHEIKNPLTPMKLQLQYLQKQVSGGYIPDKESLDRIASSLLEQIENLSNISEAFSNVAKLPKASNEKVVLNEVVESVHDLFRKREDMQIRLLEPINDLIVFADKNHLVRILNNLLKNAIEAIPEDRIGDIEIQLYKEKGDAIIKVSDNGLGIPKNMQDKIFTPKFTTKNSGSGLGLAIAANMAESFNGKIYFKTRENIGTDFFISIPLMRLSQNKDSNRVILD